MATIKISQLTFAYEGSYTNIFENTKLNLDSSWKLGLIGRNGIGKTTLLNLLCGKLQLHKGQILSPLGFTYFPFSVDVEFNCLDAVTEVFPNVELWRLQKELSLLNVDVEVLFRPFKSLSQGEQTKLLLATMFAQENNFLLIDEPTNHLDIAGRNAVSHYLCQKQGFILVSHDRDFLDSCIDHVLCIEKCRITVEKGNYSSWKENNLKQQQWEETQNEKLKKEISRLEKAAKQTENWANKAENSKIGFDPSKTEKSIGRRSYEGAKSQKMMSAAKNLKKRQSNAIAAKSLLLKNVEEKEILKLRPQKFFSERLALFHNVGLCFNGKTILKNLSFEINSGERVALTGKNGSGKTCVIKLLLKQLAPTTGKVEVSDRLKISYVPQIYGNINGNLKDFAKNNGIDDTLFRTVLRKMGFTRQQLDLNIEDFSAGQKKKVALAKSLCEETHLYVWDEPLNYIDVLSREQIEELIMNFHPTLLFVEHDKYFCDKIATKTIKLD